MRSILSLLLLCQFIWTAEIPPPTLSSNVQKALTTYDAKLSVEKQKYLAAALKVQQELKRVLDAEVKALTQKGDLDGALAVKVKLAELEKQMVIEDPLFGLLPPGTYEKTVNKVNLTLYVGRWVSNTGREFNLKEDGTGTGVESWKISKGEVILSSPRETWTLVLQENGTLTGAITQHIDAQHVGVKITLTRP